jgi:Methane oxygenase PmoA
MRGTTFAAGLIAAGWLGAAQPVVSAGGPLSLRSASAFEWAVTYEGRVVCVYAFAPAQKKPYVRALATIDGVNILRDSPADHKHHHGLMYAIRVNGINFWEETPGTGGEKPVVVLANTIATDPDGRPRAVFRHRIDWVAEGDAKSADLDAVALLIEDRTLGLTVDPSSQEVALGWHAEFRPGPGFQQVVLTGSDYNGLGMRFQADLDPVARHLIAGTQPDLGGTRKDVTSGGWGAVLFDTPDRPVTVALFGAPGNARGAPRFFSMHRPFAYLAATQSLDREPLVYRAGDRFVLDYLVTVYPGLKTAQFLGRRGQLWADFLARPRP